MTDLLGLVDKLIEANNTYFVSPHIVNLITGIMVVVSLLSMRAFKFVYSAQYRWSKILYNSACITMLVGIGFNRYANFPESYKPSGLLYIISYMLFTSYILYASSKRVQKAVKNHGNQTISTA